jgi:DNA invertase Pin-like site-specific DNA recombinase
MNIAQVPQFDMVVVKDISRLAKTPSTSCNVSRAENQGHSMQVRLIDLSTEDGELILGMLALVRRRKSANTSKRIKFSKAHQR